MSGNANVELWHQLQCLEIDHWYDVNLNNGTSAHELYIEEGLLAVGKKVHKGRETIRQFYAARAARGIRTARHLLSNFRVLVDRTSGKARATGVISLYAADKLPPFDSKPAVLMADLINEYAQGKDGVWRYASHVLQPVSVGDDPFVRNSIF